MKIILKRTYSLSVALLMMFSLINFTIKAKAEAPTTKNDYSNWFPSGITILEQKYGINNLGDENAHQAPLSLGDYQYQFSVTDNVNEGEALFYADSNFLASNYLDNYLVITFSGTNLPKSVCLGVESCTNTLNKTTGTTIHYSVNGGEDLAYVTPDSVDNEGLVIINEDGINTITLKNDMTNIIWATLSYMLLPSTNKIPRTAPDAPIVSSKTSDSVTLNTITDAEYSKDGTTWQASPIFAGLTPATKYTFYVRYAETDTQLASPSSEGLDVTTDKAAQAAPDAPTVSSKTSDKITLNDITGAEYSKDGTTWQASPIFAGLTPATKYTFYVRYAETDTQLASPSSEGLDVTTDKAAQAAPDAPTVSSKTSDKITLNDITGAEYSKDGTTWQASPIFAGLTPATKYTFYVRYAETDTQLASQSSQVKIKTNDAVSSNPGDAIDTGSHVSIPAIIALLTTVLMTAVLFIFKKSSKFNKTI